MNFADRLQGQITKSESYLCAGFDPDVQSFPKWILDKANSEADAIIHFYTVALDSIGNSVACIKPNIAFFERYGLSGIKAFVSLCSMIKERGIPCIVDAKRGDIGNTAKSYAEAYLTKKGLVEADALTVNPFLGFDTVEPFLEVAKENGKGLFILVKTSNPGSGDIQDFKDAKGETVSEKIADWVAEKSSVLQGKTPFSGLGVVVGATHPDHARALRKRMPKSFFLIPGVGAQGGSVEEALAGFSEDPKGGAVVQVSRGLFSNLKALDEKELKSEISARLASFVIKV